MKKNYSLFFIAMLFCFSFNARAITVNIAVGQGNTLTFAPIGAAATVGDVIVWTFMTGTHNVTSTSIPSGAAPFASGNRTSGTFSYTVTVAGSYAYACTLHPPSMIGALAVSVGINEPIASVMPSIAFPNPFNEKLTINYSDVRTLDVVNVVGEKIKTIDLPLSSTQVEVDLASLPSGIYFYRTYKEGILVETKKIVKTR